METMSYQHQPSGIGKKLLIGCLAVIGILGLLWIVAVIVITVVISGEKGVSKKTILEMDFTKNFIEYVPEDPLAIVFHQSYVSARDVVDALEKAKTDKRVAAFIGKIGGDNIGLAQIQEIRDAIISFRTSGKPAVAFSESFGEFGPGNGAYYLATAFDEIYLQPSGDVGLTGLIAESIFLKGTLDKLGVVPRGDRRAEYKTAFDTFTEKEYTKYNKEATQKVIDSQFGQLVKGIAEARKLSPEKVREIINKGPYLGKEAADAGLVDSLAYWDEVYSTVKSRVGENANVLNLVHYLNQAGRPHSKGTSIALIYGVGAIYTGKSGFDPVFFEPSMGSETVARAFRDAAADKDVKGILFRIDSPGGSYIASDIIWREVINARKKGKPVIVSMGNVAGSGGYFVAMGADKIVAQPATITGSIGVLSVKFLMNNFYDKLGVSFDEVHTSTNATVWSDTKDYTPEQWKRFEEWLDRVYKDFTQKVADGRKLPLEKVLEIAKGRIWSGEDAKALGLVDELGGFPTALRLMREELKLKPDAPLNIKVFTKKKSFIELLLGKGEESGESTTEGILIQMLQTIRPIMKILKMATAYPEESVLMMPETGIIR